MEYRTTDPQHSGYDDEEDELTDHHMAVADMSRDDPHDMMDGLLAMTNICEVRAMSNTFGPAEAHWYRTIAARLRALMDVTTEESDIGLPNSKLENPLLYYPPMTNTH